MPSPSRSSSRGSSRSRSRSYSRGKRYEKDGGGDPSRSRSRDGGRGGRGGDADGDRPRDDTYADGETCSLIVRNLNYDTSPQHVRSLFSRYGEIRDVYLPLDYNTGRPSSSSSDDSEVDVAQRGRKSPRTMRRLISRRASYGKGKGGYGGGGYGGGGYGRGDGYGGGYSPRRRSDDDYYGGGGRGGYRDEYGRDDRRGSPRRRSRSYSRDRR